MEANWKKVEKDNEKILESKHEYLAEVPYITEDHYSIAHESYITSKSAMIDILETVSDTNEHSLSNHSINFPVLQRRMLPKITLPKCSGDNQYRKPFDDLFTSLIIENPDLPDVAKNALSKN